MEALSMAQLDFATSEAEASARAAKFLAYDPFPSVPLSLLSSAEIHDYVRVTGLLHPFNSSGLKSASYEAHIGGEFIRWDENGNRVDREIKKGSRCVLPANSLTFVQVEPYLRLPNYIAVRFDLRNTHVHRGLLLGTGLLVDPGFSGKLLIPLHNLTATDYDLDTTQPLIWMEFTKTTFQIKPAENEASATRHFIGFPPTELNISADAHLRKANAGNPIRSAIPAAMANAQASAQEAVSWARTLAIGTLAGVAIIVLGLAVALYTYFGQLHALVQNAQSSSESLNGRIDMISANIGRLEQKLFENSSATEQRMGAEIDRRFGSVADNMEKRFGLVESQTRSSADSLQSTAAGQQSRLNAIETELQRLRGIVEKKR
jgi:deoxycytidine triphosphate deaminase